MPAHLKAVLFDLDDTIFDHQYARRSALGVFKSVFPMLASEDIKALEATHEKHLLDTHTRLLDGQLTLAESRRERMQLFCADYGLQASESQMEEATLHFRRAYSDARRPVPGVVPLMEALKHCAKIAIVTNGLMIEQEEKIQICGVTHLIDEFVVSDKVGMRKPSREIFDHALTQLGVTAPEAIFIGDSWTNDVLGARSAGLPAVWFNRYEATCPEPGFPREVTDLEPLDRMLRLLAE